jgi:hypothetical protein
MSSSIVTIPTTQVNVYEDLIKNISDKLTESLVTEQAKQTISQIKSAKDIEMLVYQSLSEAKVATNMLVAPTPPPPPPPTDSTPPVPPA